MNTQLDLNEAVTKAIGLLNDLDSKRAEQIEELREELRALSNRIEAIMRYLPPTDAVSKPDWQRRGFLRAEKPSNDEHSFGL